MISKAYRSNDFYTISFSRQLQEKSDFSQSPMTPPSRTEMEFSTKTQPEERKPNCKIREIKRNDRETEREVGTEILELVHGEQNAEILQERKT